MVKAKLYRQKAHKEAYTYTLIKRRKGKIYIYRCSQSPLPQFWDDSLSIQVFQRCRVHQVDCGDLICCSWGWWRDFPFSSLFAQLLGLSFGFGPTSVSRSPEGICSSLRQDGVKVAADLEALAHLGRGEGGVRNAGRACGGRGQRDVATSWGMPCALPGKLSLGSWQWQAAQPPGRGGVESDLCLHTGFLVAAAAALASHARLCGLRW